MNYSFKHLSFQPLLSHHAILPTGPPNGTPLQRTIRTASFDCTATAVAGLVHGVQCGADDGALHHGGHEDGLLGDLPGVGGRSSSRRGGLRGRSEAAAFRRKDEGRMKADGDNDRRAETVASASVTGRV